VFPPDEVQNYGIHYHRVFIDRLGAIYVAFTYYTPEYDNDSFRKARGVFGRHPHILLMSDDGGENWRLPTTQDFTERMMS
jgi:hypothetical protein